MKKIKSKKEITKASEQAKSAILHMKKNSQSKQSARASSSKNKETSRSRHTKEQDVNSERTQIDLDFETAMLEMSFDNLAGLMRTVGIPAPQAKKIKQQAKLIATFNQKMIQTGHPEQVINMGEKLMPWILKISTAGMFVEPLGKLLMKMGDKKDEEEEIIEEVKSTRG